MTEMVCAQCGTPFTERRVGQKYCTPTCQDRARRARTKSELHLVTSSCRLCQRPFEHPSTTPQKYCSEACLASVRRTRCTARRAALKLQLRMVTETCRECGQPFEHRSTTTQKYCSEACNKTARRARTAADYHRSYVSKKQQKHPEEYVEAVVVPPHLRPKPYAAVCLLCGTDRTTFMLSDLALRALAPEQAPQCRCGARMQLEPTLMSRAARVAS